MSFFVFALLDALISVFYMVCCMHFSSPLLTLNWFIAVAALQTVAWLARETSPRRSTSAWATLDTCMARTKIKSMGVCMNMRVRLCARMRRAHVWSAITSAVYAWKFACAWGTWLHVWIVLLFSSGYQRGSQNALWKRCSLVCKFIAPWSTLVHEEEKIEAKKVNKETSRFWVLMVCLLKCISYVHIICSLM